MQSLSKNTSSFHILATVALGSTMPARTARIS
jgi:hypothetical protein